MNRIFRRKIRQCISRLFRQLSIVPRHHQIYSFFSHELIGAHLFSVDFADTLNTILHRP